MAHGIDKLFHASTTTGFAQAFVGGNRLAPAINLQQRINKRLILFAFGLQQSQPNRLAKQMSPAFGGPSADSSTALSL